MIYWCMRSTELLLCKRYDNDVGNVLNFVAVRCFFRCHIFFSYTHRVRQNATMALLKEDLSMSGQQLLGLCEPGQKTTSCAIFIKF